MHHNSVNARASPSRRRACGWSAPASPQLVDQHARITIRLNGSSDIARGGGGFSTSGGAGVSTVRAFAVNDYIEAVAYANGTNTSSADQGTNFWAILLQAS